MDVYSLRAFVAVADAASFSNAAERLHLTQPAISKRIKSLEERCGKQLFNRIGRQISLTEAGTALLPYARRILREMDEAGRAINSLHDQVSGRLTLGISHHIGLHRLPPVLREFHRRYPQVSLDIAFMDSEQAAEAVHHGTIELAVVTLSPTEFPGLAQIPAWEDQLLFVAAHDASLSQKNRITLEELLEHDAILPGINTFTGQIIRDLFANEQLKLQPAMATNYLETIGMMVSIGLGWSVLPHTLITEQLQPLDVLAPALSRQLGLVYHPARFLSNAAHAFMEELPKVS